MPNRPRKKAETPSLLLAGMVAAGAFAESAPPSDAPYRNPSNPPDVRARDAVARMTFEEKKRLIGGYNDFFIAPVERLGLRAVYLTDATAGVHIRRNIDAPDSESVAFPCPVALAASWDLRLARAYGKAVGKECRRLGSDVLLGPGLNLYRTAACGRNFEYFGEDPSLTARMVTAYILGLQSEKVPATAKHFVCNNHEWLRHTADSVVDARALHEIYLYPWYFLVHRARVGAVMTSYNLLNGEKVSQSAYAVDGLLRDDIGFRGLAMSDWGAVWDPKAAVRSGLDLIMPHIPHPERIDELDRDRLEKQLDRMCTRILATLFRFGIYDRDRKTPPADADRDRAAAEKIALRAAREGIVLLKNDRNLLPLDPRKLSGPIVQLGPDVEHTCLVGGGSAHVEGYDHRHIGPELERLLGGRIRTADWRSVSDAALRKAGALIVCVDQFQQEGRDQDPVLPKEQEALIRRCVECNPNTVVVVCSGSGLEMEWADRAAAILWAFYPGQYGGAAIAEILTGKINPSGKLPYTIERRFIESPAHGYRPDGATPFEHKDENNPVDRALPEHPVVIYHEGVFTGYRWYDVRRVPVRFPFGHGLSYTTFDYRDLKVKTGAEGVRVSFTLVNTGKRSGAEIVQLYVGAVEPPVPRPLRELRAFSKIRLSPGRAKKVELRLTPADLAYYDPTQKCWVVAPGDYRIEVGASSRDIRLTETIHWDRPLRYRRPSDTRPME